VSSEDRITANDLLNAMAAADVLDRFCQLPEASRREFEDWIGKASDNAAHWRRIDTLVMAMRAAPLLEAELSTEPARAFGDI
jgi:ferric-dicitrate binding protein FerR (iron transport regulator)